MEAIETTNQWIRFLKSVAKDGAIEGAKEGGGVVGTTNTPNHHNNNSISEQEKQRLAAAAAEGCRQLVLRVEAAHADAQYFRDNLARGKMKMSTMPETD